MICHTLLWYYFSTYAQYILHNEIEVLNYLILFSMLYKRSIKLFMVYSPLLNNLKNI